MKNLILILLIGLITACCNQNKSTCGDYYRSDEAQIKILRKRFPDAKVIEIKGSRGHWQLIYPDRVEVYWMQGYTLPQLQLVQYYK